MLLGLDLGTTNVKALLARPDGSVIAIGSAPVAIRYAQDAVAEQDIEDIWQAALAALAQLAGQSDLAAAEAVGVSSQGGALQIEAADGTPVGPVISWLDGRGRPYDQKLNAELGHHWFARHLGHGGSSVALGQLLRLREQGDLPPNFRIGFVGDIIVSRLCGRAAHDATSLSLGKLYNPTLRTADPDVLRIVGLSEDRLPALLPAGRPAGTVLAEVARRTSIPQGIPVSPAIHDQYAAALGCGAVHAGDVMFGTGTAWVLLSVVTRLVHPVTDIDMGCTHPVDGLYGHILSLVNGGSSLSWAMRTLALKHLGSGNIDEMIQDIPPGSEGLRFWPLLAPGGGVGLTPDAEGRLDGLRLSHTPAHVLRAVVEGLACELARYMKLLAGAGVRADRLVMCGGAAAGQITPQIIADVTGLRVDCAVEGETSAMGAAVVARSLMDAQAGLGRLSEQMAPGFRVVQPGQCAERYAEILRRYLSSLPMH